MKTGKTLRAAALLAAAIINILIFCMVSYADTAQAAGAQTETAAEADAQAAADQTAKAAIAEPSINSTAGIVINADTGEVLWARDADTQHYPASITKVMTALLVMENCKMDETVTFSRAATTNLESGATTARMSQGDKMSVKDCLYALMLQSANEVANALAEHVAGSVPAFADMMNRRARELGCTNTHFVNPNGLNNEKHLTTAHDMALITAAAFKYDELRKIDTTNVYRLPPSKNDKSGLLLSLNNKMLMKNHEKYYEYAIAGKTGYTSKAGNTLVIMAEKDGVRLVTVTMKNKKYLAHYDDTRAMLEYGFRVMEQRRASGEAQSGTGPEGKGTGAAAGAAASDAAAGTDAEAGAAAPAGTENALHAEAVEFTAPGAQ